MKTTLYMILFAILASLAQAQNLLKNPSFEDWLADWNFSGSVNVFNDPSHRFDGEKYLAFNFQDQAPSGVVWQSFTTTAGDFYEVSFSIAGQSASAAKARVDIINESGMDGKVIASESFENQVGNVIYSTFSFVFQALSPVTTLVFTDVSEITVSTDLYIDGVSVMLAASPLPPLNATVDLKVVRVAAVQFDTISRVQYAIRVSTDMSNFAEVGIMVGNGSRMTFYYPAEADQMFFQIEPL